MNIFVIITGLLIAGLIGFIFIKEINSDEPTNHVVEEAKEIIEEATQKISEVKTELKEVVDTVKTTTKKGTKPKSPRKPKKKD